LCPNTHRSIVCTHDLCVAQARETQIPTQTSLNVEGNHGKLPWRFPYLLEISQFVVTPRACARGCAFVLEFRPPNSSVALCLCSGDSQSRRSEHRRFHTYAPTHTDQLSVCTYDLCVAQAGNTDTHGYLTQCREESWKAPLALSILARNFSVCRNTQSVCSGLCFYSFIPTTKFKRCSVSLFWRFAEPTILQ